MLSEFLEEKRSKSKGKTIIEVFANIEKEIPKGKFGDSLGKPEAEKHRKVKITLNAEKDVDLKEKNKKIDKLIKSKGVEYPQHFIWLDGAEDTEGIIEFPKTRVKRVYVLKGDYDNPTFMYIPQYNPNVKMSKPYYEITDTSILVHMDGFSGSGTEADPYLITSYADFVTYVKNGDRTGYYLQTNDIDCNNSIATAITNLQPAGVYDGGNYSFHNLRIDDVGLFAMNYGTIKNWKINATQTSTASYTGMVAGESWAGAVIENVHVSGTITSSTSYVGGVSGRSRGRTSHCSAKDIYITGGSYTGGIVGYVHYTGSIDNCHIKDITIIANHAGGISGGYQARDYANPMFQCSVDNLVIEGSRVGGLSGDFHNSENTGANSCSVINSTIGASNATHVGGISPAGAHGKFSNLYAANNTLITIVRPTVATQMIGEFYVRGSLYFAYVVAERSQYYLNSKTPTNITLEELKQITTFADWNIVEVASINDRNTDKIWNIVEGETTPFFSYTTPPPPQFFSAITIDGDGVTGCTIDGTPVTKITMDGITVYEA